MTNGSNTTREIASILAAVPASVWDRARATADRLAAADREWRRSQPPAAPAENPWGIRGVPTSETLRRIVRSGRGWIDAVPIDKTTLHRTRKCLLAVRRSSGRPGDPLPLDPLFVLNREIGAYGVEAFTLRNCGVVHYVNLGDTYSTTLMLIGSGPLASRRWRYAVCAWGDLAERD